MDKVANCRKNNIPSGKANIDSLKVALEEAKNDDACSQEEICRISKKLSEAYREEDIFWKQKSKVNLARNSDRCTKFFFASTKKRRVRNKIIGLYQPDNSWEESNQGLEEIATQYFNDLFSESNKSGISEMVQAVDPIITAQSNRDLTKEILVADIRKALFAMLPEKAHGPDGMIALFFKGFATLLRKIWFRWLWSSLELEVLILRLNETNICLISKTEKPQKSDEIPTN